mmetsp:Transcript_3403/g.7549  ORF Transcript_3403/g.7549 Transcript_3403/m.7549 type:complete len:502 (-) Transcript_3403:119-1624(-)
MRFLSTALLSITHGVVMDKIVLVESKLVGGGMTLFEDNKDPCVEECEEDSDCNRVCYDGVCKPLPGEPCPCDEPKKIPDMCEVNILMKYMEAAVKVSPKLLGQWTRAGFHDAGTYDQHVPEGGANGCLMNEPLMLLQHENFFLDGPIAVLKAIKELWHDHPETCIDVSSADIIQFAIFFATTRQKYAPGLDYEKWKTLLTAFEWGRPDETECLTDWTWNLPGFEFGKGGYGGLPYHDPLRCQASGQEIKEKMMGRNGFSQSEATVLIGAHTIGEIRGTFPGLQAPWVYNGRDNYTPEGPMFDNEFFRYIIHEPIESNVFDFSSNFQPFETDFSTWFRDDDFNGTPLNHLDTDVVLAFPPHPAGAYPDYSVDSSAFSVDNDLFLKAFFAALDKMSKLGVTVPLFPATPECACGEIDESDFDEVLNATGIDLPPLLEAIGQAEADAEETKKKIHAEFRQDIVRLTVSVEEAKRMLELAEKAEAGVIDAEKAEPAVIVKRDGSK